MTMRNYVALFALVAALALPTGARADIFLLDFRGFDYENPSLDPNQWDLFEGYASLGEVPQVNSLILTANYGANQYTYQFRDMVSVAYTQFGQYRFVTFTPGRFRVFEDPIGSGTAFNYGVNPPNATAPSTFIDGTLILGGSVSNFVLTLDLVANTGSFNGDIAFDEGSQLGNLPAAQLNGWTFSGLTRGPSTGAPAGYVYQVDGEIRVPDVVSSEQSTWGKIKSVYRR